MAADPDNETTQEGWRQWPATFAEREASSFEFACRQAQIKGFPPPDRERYRRRFYERHGVELPPTPDDAQEG